MVWGGGGEANAVLLEECSKLLAGEARSIVSDYRLWQTKLGYCCSELLDDHLRRCRRCAHCLNPLGVCVYHDEEILTDPQSPSGVLPIIDWAISMD